MAWTVRYRRNRQLAAVGLTVYAAARWVERMHKLAEAGIRSIAMDVTDDASMQAGVELAARPKVPPAPDLRPCDSWLRLRHDVVVQEGARNGRGDAAQQDRTPRNRDPREAG